MPPFTDEVLGEIGEVDTLCLLVLGPLRRDGPPAPVDLAELHPCHLARTLGRDQDQLQRPAALVGHGRSVEPQPEHLNLGFRQGAVPVNSRADSLRFRFSGL